MYASRNPMPNVINKSKIKKESVKYEDPIQRYSGSVWHLCEELCLMGNVVEV